MSETRCRACDRVVPAGAAACPACGLPLDATSDTLDAWRTDTASRLPRVEQPAPVPADARATDPWAAEEQPAPRAPLPAWIAWVVIAAALVVTAFVGVRLITAPAPEDDTVATDTTESPSPEPSEDPTDQPSEEPSEDASQTPSEEPSETPSPTGTPADLTSGLSVQAPGFAPGSNDVNGDPVTFVPENMVDQDPLTAWRLGGDQTGTVLTFTLPAPATITAVAIVNGWAKSSQDSQGTTYDWYHANRRVLGVEWVIGDQTFPQTLTDTVEAQAMDIPAVQAAQVQLRITSVSAPGSPPRDYTAISTVAVSGIQ